MTLIGMKFKLGIEQGWTVILSGSDGSYLTEELDRWTYSQVMVEQSESWHKRILIPES